MAKYRSVIVGCGVRAEWHARAYSRIERGELVACCDLVAQQREKFAHEFGITSYADALEMIQKEKPDLVHVVTPPTVRAEVMTMVSDERVPACIVEKPIAYQVKDWRASVELEARSATKFGVNAQFRYHPVLNRCQEALRSGKLGKVLFLDSSAGSTICDQGVHILDWAMSLNENSPVVRVFGEASGDKEMTGHQPSPDTTVAQLKFANGVYGLWDLGYTAPRVVGKLHFLDSSAVSNIPVQCRHCRVAAYAERGRTLFEEFGRWEIVSPDGVEQGYVADMEEWAEGNHAAQANFTNAMFDWLEDDAKMPGTNLKRALDQWNVILGLYASTVYRKPIDIPFDPPDDLWENLNKVLA